MYHFLYGTYVGRTIIYKITSCNKLLVIKLKYFYVSREREDKNSKWPIYFFEESLYQNVGGTENIRESC